METIVKQIQVGAEVGQLQRPSVISKFFDWCEHQEENRLGWLAVALGGHGCVLTPVTLFAIVLSGNYFPLWILAIVAMVSCLVVNLAAMPTKVTIPVFFLSILIDILIIAFAITQGMGMSNLFVQP